MDVVTIDQSKPYAITGAPRIAKGKVLIGNAGRNLACAVLFPLKMPRLENCFGELSLCPAILRGFESKALESAAKTWAREWWVSAVL